MRDAVRIGLVASLAFRVLAPVPCAAQISPGPLSRPHTDLEGLGHCLDCHGLGERNLDGRCLACHGEIQWTRDQKRGFHGITAVGECAKCHPEHGGIEMKIVRWESGGPESFDHTRAGWGLTGKHADVACRECHRPELQTAHVMDLVPQKLPHETFLGLETACASCHADPHEARFGTDCAQCHVTGGFDVIRAGGFNHDLTKYPLEGAHAQVSCEGCHDRVDGKWNRPAFQTCASCHSDPHAGSATLAGRSVDCESCHRVQSFRPSNFSVANHRATKYPLEGKHAQVACAECHRRERAPAKTRDQRAAAFEFRVKSASCTDCHGDAHGGQLRGRADHGACAACHTVDGFTPSDFTVADHRNTDFPLEGRHEHVACRDCHGPQRPSLPPLPGESVLGAARVIFDFDSSECAECHRSPHSGRIRPGTVDMADCASCHTPDTFHDVQIDPTQHEMFAFALRGAHVAVPCFECHRELAEPASPSSLLLDPGGRTLRFEEPMLCRQCHEDEHGGQFASRLDGGDCASCHDVDRFEGASAFKHGTARFVLDGAHETVACAKCHPRGPRANGTEGVIYRPIVPHRCEDCHATSPPVGQGGRS